MNLRTLLSKALREIIGRKYYKLLSLYNFCSWKWEIIGREDNVKIFDFYPYEKREILYSWVNEHEIKNEPIDYLEFGVFKGESMLKWCALNKNFESRFFGFDSFVGLQEEYDGQDIGHLDVKGIRPDIDDKRVTFIKGFFTETLPDFLSSFQPQNRLVIHMDADLYSSTLFTLILLNKIITKKTVIIFDEFAHIEHEFPAFREYLKVCNRSWSFIASREDYGKVAVRIL